MTTPSTAASQRAVQFSRSVIQQKPVYLDTETTGLNKTDEIVEISVIDYDGAPLFESLVKPTQPIPPEASRIHHITSEMVRFASPWPLVWPQLKPIVTGRIIGIYNADFDLRMMQQSMERFRMPWRESFNTFDILKLFSDFRSEYDPIKRSYRYFKLEDAGRFFNISLPNAHRATADTLLTRAVLHCIAGVPY